MNLKFQPMKWLLKLQYRTGITILEKFILCMNVHMANKIAQLIYTWYTL